MFSDIEGKKVKAINKNVSLLKLIEWDENGITLSIIMNKAQAKMIKVFDSLAFISSWYLINSFIKI